jgi:hypothetical protein
MLLRSSDIPDGDPEDGVFGADLEREAFLTLNATFLMVTTLEPTSNGLMFLLIACPGATSSSMMDLCNPLEASYGV